MAGWSYLLEGVDEALVSLGVGGGDEIGGALYAFYELSVHVLGLDEVEAVDELHVGVGDEVVWEAVLVLELLLILDGVAGDAEDGDAGFLKLLEGVAEAAGLDGAAGGVGAGIEEENDGSGLVVREMDGLAVLILEGEVFDDVVDLGCWHVLPLGVTVKIRGSAAMRRLRPRAYCRWETARGDGLRLRGSG